MSERIDEVVDQLVGTCLDLQAVVTDEEFEDKEFLAQLDAKVFKCDVCGWWFEIADDCGDLHCEDCVDKGDDDDEE